MRVAADRAQLVWSAPKISLVDGELILAAASPELCCKRAKKDGVQRYVVAGGNPVEFSTVTGLMARRILRMPNTSVVSSALVSAPGSNNG